MQIHEFRHRTPIQVLFGDMDVLRHVNNVRFLAYIEQGRIYYMQDVFNKSSQWDELGLIVAKITIEFLAPVVYRDKLAVLTRCSRLGTKSFDFDYCVVREETDGTESIVATCTSVQVAFDYASNQSMPIPDEWRKIVENYEPIFKN